MSRAAVAVLLIASVTSVGCEDDPCVAYCEAQLEPKCDQPSRDARTCERECRDFIDGQVKQGFACEEPFDAHLSCLGEQSFACVDDVSRPPASACIDEEVALDRCLGLE